MIQRIVTFLTATLVVVILAASAHAEKRVALVVGNSAYNNVNRLDNPANDAKLIAETLRGLGFVLIGGAAQLDLDKPSFDRVVQAFGAQLRGADVGLFYYAGHGVQVRGANYLVPVDANPTTEADVDFQMLDTNLVLRQMEAAGTRLNLVILDACRNNPFGGRGLRSASAGLAQMQAPEGTLISYATQPGDVAKDGSDGDSPYTKALAQTIRRPGLDIFQTFNEVGLAVMRATGGAQQPWVSLSPISGSFSFVASPAPSPGPVATPSPPGDGAVAQSLAARTDIMRTPRPRAAGESCATLRGQTGTDFYCASSVLAPQFGNSYAVSHLFSNTTSEAWVEGKPGQGIGEWITIDFDELRLVKAVIVRNGYQKNPDIFSKNSRVRRLRLVFSQGETQTITLQDRMDLQTIALDHPVSAYWVQFIIDDVYPGSTYTDTAISKLFVTADPMR